MGRKLSVEEKRDQARRDIMRISLGLFLEKGFDKTTTRDIITKAGILNGSLYNRFRNKDEILICIVQQAEEEILAESVDILEKDNDALLSAVFPGAVELYLASYSENIANLIYEVHRRWDAIQNYVETFRSWYEAFMSKYGYRPPDQAHLELILSALVGTIGNMVGCYAHGSKIAFEDGVGYLISVVSMTLRIPVMNSKDIIDRLNTILDAENMTFMGYKLSDIHHYEEPVSADRHPLRLYSAGQ